MAAADKTATFAEHIHELRSRLIWSLLFVAIGAGVGYALHDKILRILQRPLNETLYYTTPTGAFSFVVKICCVFGFIVALPVVVYQIFAFFEPLVKVRTRRLFAFYVFTSVVLASAGIAFAYFVSLPAALHFLVNFGNESGSIQALITANEYFNFVFAYVAGFAVLFQLPLFMIFINRITPLTPNKLMGGTRYVILGSFVVSAIITPTPDPFNQALMAGPIILLYFMSACIVALVNRAARRGQGRPAEPLDIPEAVFAEEEAPRAEPPPRPALAMAAATPPTPRAPRVVSDMIVPGRNTAVAAYQPRPLRHKPQESAPAPQVQPAPVRLISDFV